MKVTVLSGGVGGARFTRGLLELLRSRLPDGGGGTTASVTVVANTGDDMWLHGVRVCPDLDTLMYTLGGAVHEEQGWGRRDESRRVSDDLRAYGLGWDWFTLGDLDLATHLARTELLRRGLPLSEVTARLAERWGLGVRLLPATDDEVETHVLVDAGGRDAGDAEGDHAAGSGGASIGDDATDSGGSGVRSIHFEEWWVRHRAALPARGFVQAGLDGASAAPGVVDALHDADVVVLPPSNPVVSVGTVLAIPGVGEAVRSTAAPVVGVSPVVGGAPVRGMADACLAAIRVETDAAAVARHYGRRSDGGVLDAWLVDSADEAAAVSLGADGWTVRAVPTLMTDVATTARIAADALALVDRLP